MIERQRLPNRRRAETVDLQFDGNRYQLTIGFYDDGRPGAGAGRENLGRCVINDQLRGQWLEHLITAHNQLERRPLRRILPCQGLDDLTVAFWSAIHVNSVLEHPQLSAQQFSRPDRWAILFRRTRRLAILQKHPNDIIILDVGPFRRLFLPPCDFS